MRKRKVLIGAAALVAAVYLAPMATAQAPAPAYKGPRTADGKPDVNGIWQALSEAQFNIEPHSPQMGIQGGMGVVEGDTIPYKPEALKQRNENFANRFAADPLNKCYLPGVPRMMYLPFPFEIHYSRTHVIISSAFHHATRIIPTNGSPHAQALDLWMGDPRGRWEGDSLVVDSNDFNDQTWFDAAGNFHSADLHVVERFTPIDADHINYEATMEDPNVFTRPWKLRVILYRRLEKNLQLIDYDCVEFFWANYQKRSAGK